MASSFSKLQFVLLVGVGGGVPGAGSDIRLGDVVVSHPGLNNGGVVQFDFGKTMQDGRFVPTTMLDRPPRILLAAVSTVRSNHARGGSMLLGYLQQIYDHHPLVKKQYTHPGAGKDVLYESRYDHPQHEATCSSCDSTRILSRTPRQSDAPVIHYGLIASGNQVMRYGMTRDRLRDELGMACFEIEAAGLMGHFLLWQPYASAVAALYAKELLDTVPSSTDAHPKVRTNPFGSESTKLGWEQHESERDGNGENGPLQSSEVISISLPELVTSFQGCIQSFPELFLPPDAPSSFRLTLEKLELEKTLLLQWADRVHLLHDQKRSPLGDIETRTAVGAMLHDIESMFNDEASNKALDSSRSIDSSLQVKDTSLGAVVSSRPEHKLVAAFHNCPQLKLEDLSQPDISRYIQSKLKSPLYEYVRYNSDPASAKHLIREMVEKASRVFLWVVLACRSLLDGLAASDSPTELRQRINELPEKLEDLFRDMLTRVDKRYLLQSARILKICKLYIAQHGIGVPTLGLAQLDWHEYDSSRLTETLKYDFSIPEKDANCNRIEGRLISRCGGLLEVRRSYSLPQRFCFCGQVSFGGYHKCHETFATDSVIIFMHRSVFDFLDMEETWELDCLDLGAEHEFDAQAAVGCLSLHLAHCSANQNNSHSASQCIEHIYDAWRWVLRANWKTGTQIMHVVAALVDVSRMAQSARRWASDYPWGDFPPEKIMLRLAVEAGILDLKRDKNPSLDTLEGCYPLLFHATNPLHSNYILSEGHPKTVLCDVPLFDRVKPAHHVVRWLLSLGYCPNEEFTLENKRKLLPGNTG
ncbi:unnamed protein product [Clonostachys rhizophaga]|uniref:Nucleoside phosphorylase domain-containing protein n=1 Tax=Clonostachys rhizophaga TaxID=160324 RepID=A0A9N9VI73_9HYPO|nr:unnamed protein product [Clonostachys rhizophaga]